MKIKPLHLLLLFRTGFIVALAFTTFMALVNPVDLPIKIHIWDKLQHAAAFITLSFLLDYSLPHYHSRRTLHPAQTIFLLCYGIGIEWLQSYTSYREASLYDVLADAISLLFYWVLYFFVGYFGYHSDNYYSGKKG